MFIYRVYTYIVYFYLPRRASVNQVKGLGGGRGRGRGVQENFFSLGNSQLEKVGDALPLLLTAFVWSVQSRRSRRGRGSRKKGECREGGGERRQIAASMFVMQTNFI